MSRFMKNNPMDGNKKHTNISRSEGKLNNPGPNENPKNENQPHFDKRKSVSKKSFS